MTSNYNTDIDNINNASIRNYNFSYDKRYTNPNPNKNNNKLVKSKSLNLGKEVPNTVTRSISIPADIEKIINLK